MGCLYLLESPAGKQYVGITLQTAAVRFERHVKHAKNGRRNAIHGALLKYGPESFKVTTLAVCDDIDALRVMERNAIRVYSTLSPNGYNLSGGGEKSEFWAPETREKARISQIKSWVAPSDKRVRASLELARRMQAALQDEATESARRAKISASMKDGRVRGEGNGAARLTENRVRQIKALLGTASHQYIADQFGVSRRLIGMIARGDRWGHVA